MWGGFCSAHLCKVVQGLAPRRPAKLLGAGSARTAHSQSADFALLTRTLVACRIRGTRSVSRRAAILLIPTSARTSLTQSLQDAAEQGGRSAFAETARSKDTGDAFAETESERGCHRWQICENGKTLIVV